MASPGSQALSSEQLKLVLEVSRTLTLTTDVDVLLTRIAQATTQLLRCERASIFLHDPKTNELWTKVALESAEIRVPCTAGSLARRSAQTTCC
jgi:GAF domain-containing protein